MPPHVQARQTLEHSTVYLSNMLLYRRLQNPLNSAVNIVGAKSVNIISIDIISGVEAGSIFLGNTTNNMIGQTREKYLLNRQP